jgi:ParB/RepB/Spo0J family partition protein
LKARELKTYPIPLNKIRSDPDQIRVGDKDYEAVDDLAASINSTGLIHPIVVFKTGEGGYQLISGARRAMAAEIARDKLNGADTITATVHPTRPDQATIDDIQFAENVHRKDLAPHEVIGWTLRRFETFEIEHNRDIKAADIESILSIKQRQAYKYLEIYKADRTLVTALLDPVIAGDFKSINDYLAAIQQKNPNGNQDEQNQIEEERVGDEHPLSFKLSAKYKNPLSIQALIFKNSTAKQRRKYEGVDWQSPRAMGAAFREFLIDWESRN